MEKMHRTCRYCRHFDPRESRCNNQIFIESDGELTAADFISFAMDDIDLDLIMEEQALAEDLLKTMKDWFTKKQYKEAFADMKDQIQYFLFEADAQSVMEIVLKHVQAYEESAPQEQGIHIEEPANFSCARFL